MCQEPASLSRSFLGGGQRGWEGSAPSLPSAFPPPQKALPPLPGCSLKHLISWHTCGQRARPGTPGPNCCRPSLGDMAHLLRLCKLMCSSKYQRRTQGPFSRTGTMNWGDPGDTCPMPSAEHSWTAFPAAQGNVIPPGHGQGRGQLELLGELSQLQTLFANQGQLERGSFPASRRDGGLVSDKVSELPGDVAVRGESLMRRTRRSLLPKRPPLTRLSLAPGGPPVGRSFLEHREEGQGRKRTHVNQHLPENLSVKCFQRPQKIKMKEARGRQQQRAQRAELPSGSRLLLKPLQRRGGPHTKVPSEGRASRTPSVGTGGPRAPTGAEPVPPTSAIGRFPGFIRSLTFRLPFESASQGNGKCQGTWNFGKDRSATSRDRHLSCRCFLGEACKCISGGNWVAGGLSIHLPRPDFFFKKPQNKSIR